MLSQRADRVEAPVWAQSLTFVRPHGAELVEAPRKLDFHPAVGYLPVGAGERGPCGVLTSTLRSVLHQMCSGVLWTFTNLSSHCGRHLHWGTRTCHHASYSFESLVDDTKLSSNSGRNTVGDRSHNLWLQVERPVSVKKQPATHRSPATLPCVQRKESFAPVVNK